MQTVIKKKKGFSLLELIVAMAIIAILSVITYQLITRVQLSSRDSQRQQALQNISAAMEQAYQNLNMYPTISFTQQAGYATLMNGATALPNPVQLTGPTTKLSSPSGATNSTATQTVYCYIGSSTSYVIGAKLEGSNAFSTVGPDTTSNCSTSLVN